MKVLPFILVILASTAHAASGGKSTAGQSTMKASGSSISGGSVSRGGGGGGSARRLDPRNVPPLAEDRKISEQDCSKPIDWMAGNLKCK